ncbi:DUF2336 domain-containing protein [Bradyrhizobium sp. U87765 SZCCT0131]|uniref:DUF2336 domain-containing protein n=1 Tax=unclassified Bradyrhizobium TaxID=2631580 RepID=UPI001BA83A16|nr:MULTISPECIES: DUF2336 domain-containing protein [unclassified Bradyrhizobium]MBR1221816.1 DUF2336 domain-containing protein [Bradyrhizobium sp. U87765 SZCCT0131]MBR1263986.1 DUF2336 domain-containing protein [Bradyrhizobium sp. U87765 SZCCT0134]MBR1308231.1 DUF2336 domain-containing protein [Bradyrhizobium sp. U87765 SZCCT0110]MBR1320236.1 DUF2336 domain-containing protein [Bradyrhizobium sp. U87765 SZCCT0109]MBR1348651.1 DUF2336 domain-containing protein [Bradyrhizobium sp. U87765 SZCCT004
MNQQSLLIEQLDSALSGASAGRGVHILQQVTDLFLAGAGYSREQIELFDDVLGRLSDGVAAPARTQLAQRLCNVATPPLRLLRRLALDDLSDVATPLLAHCRHLDDNLLVTCVETRSQRHLLAICQRPQVSESVTDRLVDRGEAAVLLAIVENTGARFSNTGFGALVLRAGGSDPLAIKIGARADLPRHHFLRLLTVTPSTLHEALEAGRPPDAAQILVSRVAEAAARQAPVAPHNYATALGRTRAMRGSDALGERELLQFISDGKLDYVIAGIAVLAELDVKVVEDAFMQPRHEALLTIVKAVGLGWPTAKALLQLRGGGGNTELEQALASFVRLKPDTARQALLLKQITH